MQLPFKLIRFFANLLILQLAALTVTAAAPQQAPSYGVHIVDGNQGSHQDTLQARFYPYPSIINILALPVEPTGQTYALGPSMTINGNLIVPDTISGRNSLPLLLDTLSACTWLPTGSMRCYTITNSSNGTNSTSTAKQGDDCVGISAVGFPGQGGNTSSTARLASGLAGTAQIACPHYLAGFVSGPLLRTDLNLAGKKVSGAQVLFADGFYSTYGHSMHKFSQYYGGASGVVGLGMYDAVWDAKALIEGRQKWSGELMAGMLRELFLHHGEDQNNGTAAVKRAWSLALPRRGGGEEANGRFVVGGLVSNDTAETTGEEIVVSLSRGQGWGDVGLVRRMLYALPRVGFSIGDGDGAAPVEASEEYFFDSALPVIYTSQHTAENVSSLYSPPGGFDNITGLFMVDCNATAPDSVAILIDDGYERNLRVPVFPKDLIVPLPFDNRARGLCISAFQVNPDYPEWRQLGWPFFRNVVVTVDIDQWAANISARTWPKGTALPASSSTSTLSSTSSPPTSAAVPISTVIVTEHRTFTTTSNVETVTVAHSAPPPAGGSSSSVVTSTPHAPSSDPLHISFAPTATAINITNQNSSIATATSIVTPPGVTTIRTLPNSEALDNAPDFGSSPAPFTWPLPATTAASVVMEPSASATGPVGVRRRSEGEARSVADEYSGVRVSGKRREKGGRWGPVRWGLAGGRGGVDDRVEEGEGEGREFGEW